ncbi:hypothetical protein SDC9_52631 [bioreactor metagenome]|uniref:Uncharacterized protein n=1 Tax=bioreactor metagenome TaxID=1076179 RepID=A0A644WRG4_9ZZZZ
MSREFGIYPEKIEPRQWWGGRGAVIKGRMELYPDRQNYERKDEVSDVDKRALFSWMEEVMDPELQKLAKSGRLREWNDKFTMDSEDGRFHCEATPKNSGGGYMYIGVWEV